MALFGRSKEAFLRRFLRLEHGIPSHDAFPDLFNALDPENFQQAMLRLTEGFARELGCVIAIDGKCLRRSFDRASGASPSRATPGSKPRRCLSRRLRVSCSRGG